MFTRVHWYIVTWVHVYTVTGTGQMGRWQMR